MFNIYMYLNRAFEQFWGRFFSSLAILVDFRRFCTFCARLKTDPFGWVPSSVDFILAIAILPHARRDRFGFHFFVDFGLSLAADRLRNIAEDVKAFTLEIVFDVTQRAQRGTSQGTAVVEPFQELVLHILYLNGGDPL